MGEIVIRKHNFEVAKSKVGQLARNRGQIPKLEGFRTSGALFGLMDHRVTGGEINSGLVAPLQTSLSMVNVEIGKLYDISAQIFNAMDALDGEYISGIVQGVNAASRASDQALTAANKALDAQKSADEGIRQAKTASKQALDAQDGLRQNFIALKTVVDKLQQFKQKSESDAATTRDAIQRLQGDVERMRYDSGRAQDDLSRRVQDDVRKLGDSLEDKMRQSTRKFEDDIRRAKDDIERASRDLKGQVPASQADCQRLERRANVATIAAIASSVVAVVAIVLAVAL